MSEFLTKVQRMIDQLKDKEIELVFYRKNFVSFGHETVIFLNWKRKFFVEFYHDAKDDVDYSVSVAGYYTRTHGDLNDYKQLIFISISDLSKRMGWIGQDEFLSFEEESKMLANKYNTNFYKVLHCCPV